MTEIHELTAVELVTHYRSKALSPVMVMKHTLERLAAFDPHVNAFRETDVEGALADAARSEARWRQEESWGALDGVPVSVKDMVPTKGMATRFGSKTSAADLLRDVDSPAIAALREAGAIIFGKTTTSEFGNKIVTESPLTGVTRNPWDLSRSSGGSSGGSGVAVALGIGPLSVGTDGGGSIRIPSCWNGTFGLKPSYKCVPTNGGEGYTRLSNVGPMARCVEDAALMLTVVVRRRREDWDAMPDDGCNYMTDLDGGVRGLRIAFSPDLGLVSVEPGIAGQVKRAVSMFEDLGAQVQEVSVSPLKDYLESNIHSVQWIVNLAQTIRRLSPVQRALVDPDVLALAEVGETVPTAVFADALAKRHQLGQNMHMFFRNHDLLITPTFHIGAPKVPGLPPALRQAPPLTSWVNQTMQPAASIPCGLTPEGMPVGLQIVGRRYADALVLRACRAFEQARGPFPMPPTHWSTRNE
jgi:aspartyl-tRNA(Asn)/glutamyl-tRNA(Gln) amidotransferase subunit A